MLSVGQKGGIFVLKTLLNFFKKMFDSNFSFTFKNKSIDIVGDNNKTNFYEDKSTNNYTLNIFNYFLEKSVVKVNKYLNKNKKFILMTIFLLIVIIPIFYCKYWNITNIDIWLTKYSMISSMLISSIFSLYFYKKNIKFKFIISILFMICSIYLFFTIKVTELYDIEQYNIKKFISLIKTFEINNFISFFYNISKSRPYLFMIFPFISYTVFAMDIDLDIDKRIFSDILLYATFVLTLLIPTIFSLFIIFKISIN